MKQRSVIFLALMLVLAGTAFGQFTTLNPQGQVWGYQYIPFSARSYAANTTDTIPNSAINFWYAASPQSFNLGGVSEVSLEIVTADSAYLYVYVDELIGSTWTLVYTDSLEQDAAYTQEFPIRNSSVDKLSGRLGGRLRARVNFQNVTQGTTSPTWTPKFRFKP